MLIRLLVVVRRRPHCSAVIAASSCCTPQKKCHVCCSNKGLLPEKGTASRSISAPPQPPTSTSPPTPGHRTPLQPPKPNGTVPNPKGSKHQPSPNVFPRAFPSPSTPTGELFRKCRDRGLPGLGVGGCLGWFLQPAPALVPNFGKDGWKRQKIT